MKKNDNRGSSILMVILTVAGVGVLAAIALWVSLRNVQMKATDAQIKESFYSAEGVLEQVKAGVKQKAEEAYKEAMTKDLESFLKYKNNSIRARSGGQPSTTTRAADFKKNFKDTFKKSMDGSVSNEYKVESITYLVDKSLINSPAYPYALVSALNGGLNRETGLVRDEGNKLILEGIRVRYVSEDEQVSEIVTDITVAVPKPDVVAQEPFMDLFEYAIIGDKGVKVEAGNLEVRGNVYAGFEASNNKSALSISQSVNAAFNDSTLIANGIVNVKRNANFITNSKQKLWAENIVVDSARTELGGAAYVYDDLTVNGVGSNVKISGIYKGYGKDKTVASSSSAIIVNGKNSTIDMSGATEVALAGYSYIATGNEKLRDRYSQGNANNNVDIKMGESIAVKGNQIAYLIPGEWIGTDSGNVSRFGHNPLSYEEYKKLITETDAGGKFYTLVNTKVKAYKTGKTLEDYGVNSSNVESNYSKIFVQPITGISSDGLVYFYLNLPQDKAAQYFNDFYAADKNRAEELKKHVKFYTASIQSAADANIKTAGNYTIVGSELTVMPGKNRLVNNLQKYFKNFRSLCTNLTTKVIAGQRENEVFNNIINTSVLNTYLSGRTSREVTYNGAKAVIASGDYTFNNNSGNVRLIIAKGDVYVNQRFTGTIIAGRKVKVNSAGNVSTDNTGLIKLLIREPFTQGGSDYFYKVFKDGEALAAISTESGNALSEDGSVDLSSLISYSNWKKK